MAGLIGSIFGTAPKQQGTAISPGQDWWQQQLQPMLQQGVQAGMSGQGLWQTPQTPQAQGYQAQGYTSPQAPFSSPMDMIQSGEMNTAQNLMQQFYSGGGGGSAMGGLSGQGQGVMGNVLGNLAQGAVGRYAQMQQSYDQMRDQAAMYGAGAQNQANQFQAGAQNQMNMMGYGAQQQANAAPWDLANQYPTTFGSPMVGEQGALSRWYQTSDSWF